MSLKIRSLSKQEQLYAFLQHPQISGQTGCVGYMEMVVEDGGYPCCTAWHDVRQYLNTQEFIEDKDVFVEYIRHGKYRGIPITKYVSTEICFGMLYGGDYKEGSYVIDNGDDAELYQGFRYDSGRYTYIARLTRKEVNKTGLWCFVYIKDWFEEHVNQALNGIRFVTKDYENLFKLEDGGKITIFESDGTPREAVCRYVDNYHMIVKWIKNPEGYLCHICEFAEYIENNNMRVRKCE